MSNLQLAVLLWCAIACVSIYGVLSDEIRDWWAGIDRRTDRDADIFRTVEDWRAEA